MGPLTEDSPRVHSPCTPAPSLPHSTLSSSLAAMLFKGLFPPFTPTPTKNAPAPPKPAWSPVLAPCGLHNATWANSVKPVLWAYYVQDSGVRMEGG